MAAARRRVVVLGGRALVLAVLTGLTVWAAPPTLAASGEDSLRPGESLTTGQALVSQDGAQTLVLQPDGNLALFDADGDVRWASGTAVPGASLALGADGDVVLVGPDGTPSWSTGTAGTPGARLVLQDDGDLVVLDSQGAPVWDSGTTVRPSILLPGETLAAGQSLSSPDGRHTLLVLDDGDVVLLGPDARPRWALGTHEPGGALELRADGNLVVRDEDGHRWWRSRTAGHEGSSLVLQDDGNLVLYDAAGVPLWRSGTVVGPDVLADGRQVVTGADLASPDGHLRLRLGSDSLTLAYDEHEVWTAPLARAPGADARLVAQDDGNVVLYAADGAPLWSTQTPGVGPGVNLRLEDGALLLQAATGQELWRVDVPAELTAPEPTDTDCTAVDAPIPLEQTVVTSTGVRVHPCLAAPVDALILQARAEGIDLHAWGWRSAEQQIALRAANCSVSADGSVVECRPPTAPPGTSRHERGLALDFTVGGRVVRSGSAAFDWLAEHAPSAGLENLPSEPWHWSVDGW